MTGGTAYGVVIVGQGKSAWNSVGGEVSILYVTGGCPQRGTVKEDFQSIRSCRGNRRSQFIIKMVGMDLRRILGRSCRVACSRRCSRIKYCELQTFDVEGKEQKSVKDYQSPKRARPHQHASNCINLVE